MSARSARRAFLKTDEGKAAAAMAEVADRNLQGSPAEQKLGARQADQATSMVQDWADKQQPKQ